jgi:glucokinase
MAVHAPQTPLSQAERPFFVGVDVGGTNIKFGLVDNQGRTIEQTKIRTEAELGPANAVQRMADGITDLLRSAGRDRDVGRDKDAGLDKDDFSAIGLATPGTMDIAAGMVVLEPPNLPTWRHFPIRDRLRDAVGKPVWFANDANAAAFGEYWVGTGKQLPSLIMLTLGTGVGGGIIVGDHSIDGEHSHGSECGHIIIDHGPNARVCSCGRSGHLEAYASATALIHRTEEVLRDDRPSSVRQRLSAGDRLTPLLLAEEAERGDTLSLELILELARFLAVGVTSLVHTIDPGAVVLGGAMNFGGNNSELGRRFLDEVRAEFRRRTFPVLAEKTLVDFAQLAGDAGYVGAAGIARAAWKQAT